MQTKAERIALIKATAKAFYAKRQAEARFEREEKYEAKGDEMHWSDASKYAKEYYGETFTQTTKFDRDEDSYEGMYAVEDDTQDLTQIFARG